MLKSEFEPFCERNQGGMYRVAIQAIQDCQKAEDAVQEALFRIYKIFEALEFETERQEKVYALRAAKNAALDILRKEKVSCEFDETAIASVSYRRGDTTVGAILAQDFGAAVSMLVNGLSEKAKAIFCYREMGLSDIEIAATLEISVSDVRTTAFRTRKKLMKSLKREGLYVG